MKSRLLKILILVFCVSFALFAVSCSTDKQETAKESTVESVVESDTASESIIESGVESGEESETESQEESETVHECDYTELKYNSTHHWYECSCGAKDSSTEQAHAGGTATCTQKAVCTTCSQAYGSTLAHSYTELKYNSTHHWYECTCGAKDSSTEQAHAGGTATCEELAVCDVCREAYGTYGRHNMVEGECTVCGAKESQGLEYELNADQTGYIVVGIGTCNDTDLIIPTTYQGKPVTSIGEDAFD
ncbi:MAG: hypothetical protein IKA61_02045, partial [Clostridia bacterium]|nr:hypothetical protein [Clostridia bacterium]